MGNRPRKQSAVMSLDLDLTPLWDSINGFFPIMFAVFAVAGGLGVAIALGRMLIGEIRKAFGGGG